MTELLYLKLNNGDTYKIDGFHDINVFMNVIDEFLTHNRVSNNYTNHFFKCFVDDGNSLAFNALDIRSIYVKRDENSKDRIIEQEPPEVD